MKKKTASFCETILHAGGFLHAFKISMSTVPPKHMLLKKMLSKYLVYKYGGADYRSLAAAAAASSENATANTFSSARIAFFFPTDSTTIDLQVFDFVNGTLALSKSGDIHLLLLAAVQTKTSSRMQMF